MSVDQITALLREFGFPVFVALWFMIRLERRVDRLSELLSSLMQATAIIAKSVEPKGLRSITDSYPIPAAEKEKA